MWPREMDPIPSSNPTPRSPWVGEDNQQATACLRGPLSVPSIRVTFHVSSANTGLILSCTSHILGGSSGPKHPLSPQRFPSSMPLYRFLSK